MKLKIQMIVLILMFALLCLTACGDNAQTKDEPNNTSVQLTSSDTTSSSGSTAGESDASEKSDPDNPDNPATTDANGATIIAKSSNVITDSEKQKILDELNLEVDSLINSINALDDVSESDLTFEQ